MKTHEDSMYYVAFIRGINVGGNTIIKMATLKELFEKAGCANVHTILASGNVLFDSPSRDKRLLQKKLEASLTEHVGRSISINIRSLNDLQTLSKGDPFKKIPVTKDTRLYVTFLDKPPAKHLKTTSPFFRIVKTCPFAVCSVLLLTPDSGSLDLMASLEKHYGKNITTRNWNTIQKILAADN